MLTKTTNMTFAPPIPSNSNKLGFILCQVFSLGVYNLCLLTGRRPRGCQGQPWALGKHCVYQHRGERAFLFLVHLEQTPFCYSYKDTVPEWPENCRVIAVFPSHLPPMLPSNKFYSPYVDRLYRKCSQKYILNFLGIDDGICIQHSDVNSRSSPTFFQFRRQSPIRIVPSMPYFTASLRHIWAQFSNQRNPASRSC